MPIPLQLLEAIPGAHVDSAVFVLSQGFVIRHLVQTQSRPFATKAAIQTLLVCCAAVACTELAAPFPAVADVGEYVRCGATRSGLLALAAAVNWLLIAARRRHAIAATKLRKHLRALAAARAARRRADAANRVKNEFVAALTHELRTPLNAIIASADAVSRAPIADVQRGHLRRIVKESTRLGKTLNEALELRRIEEFAVPLDSHPMDPVEVAREIADLFEARAREKGLEMEFSTAVPAGLSIAGDARRFRQVLANLIDNAIKFSTRGKIQLAIAFTPAPSANSLSLLAVTVRDGGVGVTVDQRASLLAGSMHQPSTAGLPATGMGLAIAQKIVRLFGGEITVRSRPGEGSEFGFTIPVTVLNIQLQPIDERPLAGQNRRRVLIVDDVAANRIMLQMFLEQQGFAADYAAGGEEAVGLASRNRYDAVLMDLNMPDIDGLTATQRIRAGERREARSVIVAVTAAADGDTRAKCFAAGMDGYFVKPLELRRFCADLTDLIAARQMVRSH